MKLVKFEIYKTDEKLISQGGLALVGRLLEKTNLRERIDGVEIAGRPRPEIKHGDVILSMLGLLCMGKSDFEDIEGFRNDEFFRLSLGLEELPSAATLRQRLDELAKKEEVCKIIREENLVLLKKNAPQITGCLDDKVALDIDVTPFDNSGTKKEGVSCTYKKVEGYAPIFAYAGEEGYLVNCNLREGKQHSQNGTPEFLRDGIRAVWEISGRKPLVRMDSGFDDKENIQVCEEERADYVIKRNLRKESQEEWLTYARNNGELSEPRKGKEVYVGRRMMESEERSCEVVFEVTVRTMTPEGQKMLISEVEVETFWTNLKVSPQDVVELYHQHGTSEQFHSEIKSDLDMERLPSGKFATNNLMLLLGMVAYNILRLVDQMGLIKNKKLPMGQCAPIEKNLKRRRLRSVIQDIMYIACRLVRHARRWAINLWCKNPWSVLWEHLYVQLCAG